MRERIIPSVLAASPSTPKRKGDPLFPPLWGREVIAPPPLRPRPKRPGSSEPRRCRCHWSGSCRFPAPSESCAPACGVSWPRLSGYCAPRRSCSGAVVPGEGVAGISASPWPSPSRREILLLRHLTGCRRHRRRLGMEPRNRRRRSRGPTTEGPSSVVYLLSWVAWRGICVGRIS